MEELRVSVLGPVEASRGGRSLDLGGPQQRALLALLAVGPGMVMPIEALIDGLWPDDPPASARKVVQTYVSRLRRELGAEAIERRGGGYALRLEAASVDLLRFQKLSAKGRFAEALVLWRGPALGDVATMPGLRPEAERLEELRVRALEERIEADVAGGRYAEVVPELRALIASHSLRERLRALLMRALYGAGRQAEALAAYRDTRKELVDELGIEPGSELKLLERRILAQDATLLRAGRGSEVQLADGDSHPAANRLAPRLPPPATPFVGRRRELEDLLALLADDEVRLLTLTGPGGIGKTRLALQASTAGAERFPDGVVWIGLASLRDPALVAATAAHAAGIRVQGGEGPAEALSKALADKRALLLLDNAEHLLPSVAAEIAALHAGGLRLLVTSRERLQLRGEQVYNVPPLPSEDAVALFVMRAAAVGARVGISSEAAEVCRRLDDLPLALELAAARAVMFSPRQLLRRLDQRLDLLRGARDSDPRHATLRATIEWSYELLSDEEQELFRRLSVFAGSCTLEGAEKICGADVDTLQSLVDKSLLRFSNERFWMLETIRAYAKEEHDRRSDATALHLRHARYYLAFAKETKAKLRSPDRSRWVEARAAELDNLRAALGWSIESGSATLAREVVLAFSGATLVRPRELRDWIQRVLELTGNVHPVLEARVLKADGYAALVEGDYDSARASLAEAVPALREAALSPDIHVESEFADALAGLAEVERIDGQPSRARRLFKEAAQVAEHCGAQRLWNSAVFGLAHVEFDQENHDVSRELLFQLDVEGMIWPLQALGDIAMAQDDVEAAARYYHRCLERAHAEAARRAMVYALAGLAAAASRRGDRKGAGRLWGVVETVSKTLPPGLMPHDESRYRKHLQGSWTTPSFDAGRAVGHGLSLDQAVASVLDARHPHVTP